MPAAPSAAKAGPVSITPARALKNTGLRFTQFVPPFRLLEHLLAGLPLGNGLARNVHDLGGADKAFPSSAGDLVRIGSGSWLGHCCYAMRGDKGGQRRPGALRHRRSLFCRAHVAPSAW